MGPSISLGDLHILVGPVLSVLAGVFYWGWSLSSKKNLPGSSMGSISLEYIHGTKGMSPPSECELALNPISVSLLGVTECRTLLVQHLQRRNILLPTGAGERYSPGCGTRGRVYNLCTLSTILWFFALPTLSSA